MSLIEGTNLRKTYRLGRGNDVRALRGVDVEIDAGEMVAIMGPSGSGKSTLMHLLGLLHQPDRPAGAADEDGSADCPGAGDGPGAALAAASLRFGGREMLALSEGERTRIRAREMGFVFQDFNLVPTLTALENVLLATEYAGRSGAGARQAALDALALVGLADRANHRPAELSGGEQQRVAIARALVNRPSLVLADEPTGNLDSARTADILALLRKLNRERGQTFVIVTHDAEVGQACDRVIWMRDGLVRDDRTVAREWQSQGVER